jgi:hypothetical protein
MFLRYNRRFKDGKEHRWNVVENERCAGGKVVQRQVLYLREINDSCTELNTDQKLLVKHLSLICHRSPHRASPRQQAELARHAVAQQV